MIALYWETVGSKCKKLQRHNSNFMPHMQCDDMWKKLEHLWANSLQKDVHTETTKACYFRICKIRREVGAKTEWDRRNGIIVTLVASKIYNQR